MHQGKRLWAAMAFLSLVLLLSTSTPLFSLNSPEQVLEIYHAWFDGGDGSLKVELLNISEEPVVAWNVTAFEVRGETEAYKSLSVTHDAYLWAQTEDVDLGRGPIRPGEKRVLDLGIQADEVPGLVLRVTAVVMEDGSPLGDPTVISAIREEREAAHEVRAKWFPSVQALLEADISQDDLRARLIELRNRIEISERVESSSSQDSASFAKASLLRHIDTLLHYMAESPEQAQMARENVLGNLRREFEAGLTPLGAQQPFKRQQ
jgi:hypothetical protein